MAKSFHHTHDKYGRRYSSKKKRYTDAQRAAYWKKQFLACDRRLAKILFQKGKR